MACNCSKNSPKPTGYGQGAATPQSAQAAQRAGADTAPGTPGARTTGTSGQTQSFTLTSTSGRVQTFGSRLEAQAARKRLGGGTIS